MVVMDIELSWVQRLILRLSGRVYVEHRTRSGWRGPIAFFAFRCPEHGTVIDYRHGFNNRLECPECDYISKT